jgi:hypothetical protein
MLGRSQTGLSQTEPKILERVSKRGAGSMEGPDGRGRSHIEGPSGAPAPSSGGELHQEGQDGLHVLTHRGRYLREIEEAQAG